MGGFGRHIRSLRGFRILLEILFGIFSVVYFTAGGALRGLGLLSAHVQLLPLMIAETAGVFVVWIVITLLLGRVYCSSVCPVGLILDLSGRLRRFIPSVRGKVFRYTEAGNFRYIFLAVYLLLLLCGLTAVAWILDPWSMFANCLGLTGVESVKLLWADYGMGLGAGIIVGSVSLLVLVVGGIFFGRDFCNTLCPIGLGLSLVSSRSVVNIVIEPDRCTGCMACEYVCKASCIKVVGHYIDNTRCIRCFDCTYVCEEDAINLRAGLPRAGTPLMQRTTRGRL